MLTTLMPGIVVLNFQADKQALQEELTRRLCQKDEEIAVLSSENEVGGVWLHNYFVWIWKDTSYCTLSITSQIDYLSYTEGCPSQLL